MTQSDLIEVVKAENDEIDQEAIKMLHRLNARKY